MEKYLIEVPHAGEQASCARAVNAFLASGSHFATNVDWGCKDGEHKAWLIVEVESKEQAMRILPAAYKPRAKITKINKFTREDMDKVVSDHHHSQEKGPESMHKTGKDQLLIAKLNTSGLA